MVELHVDILPPAQRRIWAELDAIPSNFVLYGGTAIALQLGHRQSVDFAFFARSSFDPTSLAATNTLIAGAETLQSEPNTLTVRVWRGDPVMLSFFGLPQLPVLCAPHRLAAPAVAIGDLLELGGMKAAVVLKRAEAKDYLDIHALFHRAQYSLADLLGAAVFLYGTGYSPELTLKALSYFGDGNLAQVPEAVRRDLQRAVRGCDPLRLPRW